MKKCLWLVVTLFQAVNVFAQLIPPGGGGGGTNSGTPIIPNTNRCLVKFAAQQVSLLDTNRIANEDTELYTALASIPDPNGTEPFIQTKRFNNAILVKASHFDYSGEDTRDLAFLVSDKVDFPAFKPVDLAHDTNDGWVISSLINRYSVTDPFFLLVTNIPSDCNAFFRVIPYSGPTVTLTGAQDYDVVSNTLTLHADISDLSGATNHQVTITVDDIEVPYSVGPSNTISIQTRYVPNGYATAYVKVSTMNAVAVDPTNAPAKWKLDYTTTATLSLDFENSLYVYFAGDQSETAIGTNYTIFGVTPPHYLTGTIRDLATGRLLKSFSGYNDPICRAGLELHRGRRGNAIHK